jgi:alkylation response protein AidB-like acyl-CoA dehydrogenase
MTMFQLDPEIESFRADVRKFAEKAFKEKAAYWDEEELFPTENRNLLAELGYLGLVIPEQYGGSGASVIQGTVFLEEIARVCFNTGLVCQLALNGPSRAITILGTDEQKKRWLPKTVSGEYMFGIGISEPHAGSGMTDMTTTALPDGDHYVLKGEKAYCTGGHLATHILVFARFAKDTEGPRGIGALIIEKDTPGFTVSKPARKMGRPWHARGRAVFRQLSRTKGKRAGSGRPEQHEEFQDPDEFVRSRTCGQRRHVPGCRASCVREGHVLLSGTASVSAARSANFRASSGR